MQQGIQASIPTIVDDPAEFYGSTTTVTGGVVEVVEPSVFAISDPANAETLAGEEFGALAEEEAILVVNGTPNAPQPNLSELANVQVTGAVRELNVAEFEQEAGLELDDEALSAWEGQPAILAQQIQQTQGGGTTSQ